MKKKSIVIFILLWFCFLFISCSSEEYEDIISEYRLNEDTLGIKAVDFILRNRNKKTDLPPSYFMKAHINHCLAAWKNNRYMHNLTWEQFCEHILPFKYDEDDIESKANTFASDIEFYHTLDSSLSVFQVIDSLKYKYRFIGYSDDIQRTTNTKDFLAQARANCGTMTLFNEKMFSALGFAVTRDYITRWANASSDHAWNAVIYNGITYPFDSFFEEHGWIHKKVLSNTITDTLLGKKRISKVFRQTFSTNKTDISTHELPRNIPEFFKRRSMIDVSNQYFETTDITIDVPENISSKFHYVWIMTFDNIDFTPAYWAKIEQGKAVFKNMGRDILYFFGIYENNHIETFGEPTYCDSKGSVYTFISSENETEEIALTRKYPYINVMPNIFNSALHGACFYGYDESGRKNLLKVINDSVSSLCDTLILPESIKPYQEYLLSIPFKALKSTDPRVYENDYRTLADINIFIKNDKNQLISTPLSVEAKYREILDNNTLTYFSPPTKDTVKIKISLNEPRKIYALNLTPRNDKNYIYKGFMYELMMWKNNEWHSLGMKEAKNNELKFSNIPKGAILRLRCKTEGEEERIFRYVDKQQIWY